jgi:hypothetical protein
MFPKQLYCPYQQHDQSALSFVYLVLLTVRNLNKYSLERTNAKVDIRVLFFIRNYCLNTVQLGRHTGMSVG